MAGRDNFSPKTRKEIAERAAYICSFPNCGRMTVGPSNDRVSGVTMTGTAAHIVAAASGGQRANSSLTAEQRSAAENGIWMCAIHGKWIDDNPSIATVEMLHGWKSAHEAEISAWVEHGHAGIAHSWDRLAALTRDQTSLIESNLPNGHRIDRSHEALLTTLADAGSCLVTGDSGVGKSALVKATLDEHCASARQIWFGPEALRAALSEAQRHTLGLSAPLADLLETTAAAQNIIVFDAVERADAITVQRLIQLIRRLISPASQAKSRWQVIAIGQQSGFEVHLDPLINALRGRSISVAPLDNTQVQTALASVPVLAAYATDHRVVAMLSNLKVLGWMVEAGPHFNEQSGGQLASVPQLADRLWARWTAGDPDLHSFMIALACRDAEYERSFALSDLSPAERTAWKAGRNRLPLALSSRNRLSFTHDLASDWARFHALKEMQDTMARWSALAHQPLWIAAMRLFAQFLLRQPDTADDNWDNMFAKAKASGANDVVDILLDGLCTDPGADAFLTQRAALLFADNGKLLNRLLNRFMHISTEPDRSAAVTYHEVDSSLYAEAEMRLPTWRLWPPIIRFMVARRVEIAALGSATVSRFCQYWLTKTPLRIDSGNVLGRAGIAELALETARVDQIQSISYSHYSGSSDASAGMFEAALAGAPDDVSAVTSFALEMARRRPLSKSIQEKVNVLRRAERVRRETYEPRNTRHKPPPPSLASFGFRKLPPWPLGPSGRLNDAFRRAVLKNNALNPMMVAAPVAAAEVLLACVVDDTPQTEAGNFALEPRLGLNQEHDDRPALYWTSPFYAFLMLNTETALDALVRLVDFCTEQWTDTEEEPPSLYITLAISAKTWKIFQGNWQVLDWSQRRSASNSQLYAALDALERWLWGRLQAGDDIGLTCSDLLARTSSVAILGVLANCAKLEPRLLRDALAPLLTSPILFYWDEFRLGQRLGVDAFTWQRAGEAARVMGIEWEQASHRATSLKQVIRDNRQGDALFDAQVRSQIEAWPAAAEGLSLRQRALIAELDPANYYQDRDADGITVTRLRYPADIAADIQALAQPDEPNGFPEILRDLERLLGADLDNAQANKLYNILDNPHDLPPLSEIELRVLHRIIASLLLTRAWTWAADNPEILERLIDLAEQAVPLGTVEANFNGQIAAGPDLAWAAVAALCARAWKRGQTERWDRIVSFGLATGIPAIVATIVAAARGMRSELGQTYFAILETAALSAALGALGPRMDGDPASGPAVARWRERLARRPLRSKRRSVSFDLVALAERVERLWRARFERAFGKQLNGIGRRNLRRRFSFGLAGDMLTATFDWAMQPFDWTSEEDRTPLLEDLPENRAVIRMLWDFTAWRLRGDPDEPCDRDDHLDRLDDFGLTVIRTIAARVPLGSVSESRMIWEPVLALGPRGGFAVEHLINCFFLRLFRDIDPAKFISNWEAMLAYVFAPTWFKGGKWWRGRQILRVMLGLDASSEIAAKPQVLEYVECLAPYYEKYAREHIASDDSEIAAFANFMASKAGRTVRLSAISWIEDAIGKDSSKLKSNAAGALSDLVKTLLAEHASDLIAAPNVRRSLNSVIARLVRDQAPYALALQDRARALR